MKSLLFLGLCTLLVLTLSYGNAPAAQTPNNAIPAIAEETNAGTSSTPLSTDLNPSAVSFEAKKELKPVNICEGSKCSLMVTFDAPIDKITVEKFRQDTTGIPSGTTVLLNSTSGDLNSGVQLGLYIRNQRFNTSIGRAPGLKTSSQAVDGECFSACLLAFAGGVNRQIDPNDRLGFDALRARSKADTPAQFKEAVSSLGKYLDQMGVDRRLIDLMLETKGTTVQPLEWSRAKQLNLINTNVTTTFPWRIQALENGLLVVLATEKQVSGRYIISLGLTRQNNDYRLTIFVKPSSNGQNLGGLIDFLNSNGNLKLVAGKQVIKPTSIKPWQATTTGMQTIASLTEQDLLQLSSALEFELYLQDLGTNTYGLDNVTIFGTSGLKGAMKTLKK